MNVIKIVFQSLVELVGIISIFLIFMAIWVALP